jgi:sulfotransferase
LKKIVFISGLPRSGSTLLSAILNQNPEFESGISDPLIAVFEPIRVAFNNKVDYDISHISPEKIDKIFKNIIDDYHDTPDKKVFFNHNRKWTSYYSFLERIYPNYKMIITVRDIGWILDSFEVLYKNNIYKKPLYYNFGDCLDVYSRCESIMNMLGVSYHPLKDFLYSNKNNNNVLVIDYDALVSNPEIVIKSIYNHIEEPYFQHDFNNIIAKDFTTFDNEINMPLLHKVKKIVSPPNRKSILPPDIWERYSGLEIWKNLKS